MPTTLRADGGYANTRKEPLINAERIGARFESAGVATTVDGRYVDIDNIRPAVIAGPAAAL